MVLKLPEKWYVGFAARSQDDAPLGFMTPEGTDKAARNRKATVDGWRSKDIAPRTIENKKLTGFKLSESIRRYSSWGSGNVKWRITDPRGFELEISSPNLMQILNCSTIEQGEILDACIWGREGADNILIPVTSNLYKTALEDTKRQTMKVSMKDVKPGNKVTLQDGEKYIFLGGWYQITADRSMDRTRTGASYEFKIETSSKKRYFLQKIDDLSHITITVIASPKIATIDDCSTMTDNECWNAINAALTSDKAYLTGPSRQYLTVAVTKTVGKISFSKQENTRILRNYVNGVPDVANFGDSYNARSRFFIATISGDKYIINTSYYTNGTMKNLATEYAKTTPGTGRRHYEAEVLRTFVKVESDEFLEKGIVTLGSKSETRSYFYGGSNRIIMHPTDIRDVLGLYDVQELVVHVDVDTGQEIKTIAV